jgi:hypothetical protein
MPSAIPTWMQKLARRLITLRQGRRYVIMFTADGEQSDWTVTEAGKIERP